MGLVVAAHRLSCRQACGILVSLIPCNGRWVLSYWTTKEVPEGRNLDNWHSVWHTISLYPVDKRVNGALDAGQGGDSLIRLFYCIVFIKK